MVGWLYDNGVVGWKDTGSVGGTGRGDEEGVLHSQSPAGVHGARLGMDEEFTESLQDRIKGRAGTGDVIVGYATGHPNRKNK